MCSTLQNAPWNTLIAFENELFSKHRNIIGLKLLNALIGEWVLGHLLNNLVGHGGNVSSGQCAVGDMDGITDRSRNNFGMNIRVVAEDLADGLDEIDTGLADVIKTSEEGADVSSTGTRSQQCLIGREDEGAVGGDALGRQCLDGFQPLGGHGDFYDHMLGVQRVDGASFGKEQMLHHPLTDAGIEKFKADYTKVFGNK